MTTPRTGALVRQSARTRRQLVGRLHNKSAGLAVRTGPRERAGTWGADRPSTRSPMRPRPPASSTARSGHGNPETGGANRSGRERYARGAGEYGSAPGLTFIKGTAIALDSAGPLYAAIGAARRRGWRSPGPPPGRPWAVTGPPTATQRHPQPPGESAAQRAFGVNTAGGRGSARKTRSTPASPSR